MLETVVVDGIRHADDVVDDRGERGPTPGIVVLLRPDVQGAGVGLVPDRLVRPRVRRVDARDHDDLRILEHVEQVPEVAVDHVDHGGREAARLIDADYVSGISHGAIIQ